MTPSSLVRYRIAYPGIPLPRIKADLYEYLLAGNGVFVRGDRREFSALLPIASGEIRGLVRLEPKVELRVPRVPPAAVLGMLECARQAQGAGGMPAETLFHLSVDEAGRWRVEIPEQLQGPARVKPLDDSAASSYARALVEVHSHVDLPAEFSTIDDGDEVGFRLYGILGRIFTRPELRVRIGLYGYRFEIPAREVFELPPGVSDAYEV